MTRERMPRRLLDQHLSDARRERRDRRRIGVIVGGRNVVVDSEREGHHPFLTHMILMNSPSAKSRNGALLARSCWASIPHQSSFETWPITATSREKPGSGPQSRGDMPAMQIMATMLKVIRSSFPCYRFHCPQQGGLGFGDSDGDAREIVSRT